MNKQPIENVSTPDEAIAIAKEWQLNKSNSIVSYNELLEWNSYFESLADKFPQVRDEFQENGII